MLKSNEFQCDICLRICLKNEDKEFAQKEFESNFTDVNGVLDSSEQGTVCADCYHAVMSDPAVIAEARRRGLNFDQY
ncbi:MAG: hypothetical protein EOP06_05295 [Proteobacteria bacterium]|nr:MAG: hypothetical protein EOP06_05295 [Pseudomonadota bacterium]